ncbi:serine hydrolase domain-containing protein [Aliikangiella coralliicola]|uniref:Serine hydrolase n=1 Tax=Aliikangiella coralliicola TaxID=2592383 RepID=A0A545UI43_9GAMM|nr:serine hydrolase [Aliikangiella coralliicola]TQV89132.1 serine hydrolase [Aliikangiella coralliicola]
MKKTSVIVNWVLCVCVAVWLSGCGGGSSGDQTQTPPVEYKYSPPLDIGDGWQVGDLDQLNIDPTALEILIKNIQNKFPGYLYIDSLVIAHNGQLVLEEQLRTSLDFADGWASNQDIDLHVINSVTKSYTSALIGIAIDQNLITGVDVPVHDFFQHKQPLANWSESKASITLEHWLNMQSGYNWDEWNVSYLDSTNLNSQMNNALDPIRFLLERPMATEPGTTFAYSTGISFGIGRILQLASGMSVADFLREHLLIPLNITKFDYWSLDNQLHTGSALYLTTRDMAKFGQLFLDGGVWNGARIISEDWVARSTTQRVNLNESGSFGYGYQWWMNEYHVGQQTFKSYSANGYGGQYIFVFPEIELVIAMTGSAYLDGQTSGRDIRAILQQTILPSFVNAN